MSPLPGRDRQVRQQRGGVYRLKNSPYVWLWYYDRSGKRCFRSSRTSDRKQAQDELRRIIEKVNRGEIVNRQRGPEFAVGKQLLSRLSEQEAAGSKAASTAKKDYVRIRKFIEFCEGHDIRSESEIDSEVLQDFLNWLPKNDHRVSPVTANRYVDAVRGVLGRKVPVRKNRERRGVGKELSQETIDAILGEADSTFRLFLILLIETGLRTGHLCSVERSWLKRYLGRTFIQFPPQIGGGRKKAPMLPLTDTALAIVKELPASHRYLFDDGSGKPLYTSARVFELWRQIRRRLGFEGRPYDLRHTFAIREIVRTGNIAYVSQMLGHSDPATTLRYYQNLSALRLGEIVQGANPSGVKPDQSGG